MRIRSRVGHLKVPSPEFDSNTCAEFVLIFKEMRGDGGEILFIALHEGHGLRELRARCAWVSSCGTKPCLEREPLRAMTAERRSEKDRRQRSQLITVL